MYINPTIQNSAIKWGLTEEQMCHQIISDFKDPERTTAPDTDGHPNKPPLKLVMEARTFLRKLK